MSRDPHGYGIEVGDRGDRVRALVGAHLGHTGRVVVRRFKDAFGVIGVVFEVDFEVAPQGRGYNIIFQPAHLERIAP